MKRPSMTIDTFTTNIISMRMMTESLWTNPTAIRIVMRGWYTATLTIRTYIIDMRIRSQCGASPEVE